MSEKPIPSTSEAREAVLRLQGRAVGSEWEQYVDAGALKVYGLVVALERVREIDRRWSEGSSARDEIEAGIAAMEAEIRELLP